VASAHGLPQDKNDRGHFYEASIGFGNSTSHGLESDLESTFYNVHIGCHHHRKHKFSSKLFKICSTIYYKVK